MILRAGNREGTRAVRITGRMMRRRVLWMKRSDFHANPEPVSAGSPVLDEKTGLRVAIFGLGYVGRTQMCCLARSGFDVLDIDPSPSRVEDINAARAPFAEPMVPELLEMGRRTGRVRAVHRMPDDLDAVDLALVCVGTPSGPDGAHDISHIAQGVGDAHPRSLTAPYRSTMLPGTMETLIAPIFEAHLDPAFRTRVEFGLHPRIPARIHGGGRLLRPAQDRGGHP